MKYYIQDIEKCKTKYKKNNISFDYIPENKMEDMQMQNPNINIIGSISLVPIKKTKKDVVIVTNDTTIFQYELDKDIPNSILGYVLVFDNTYVAISKKKNSSSNSIVPLIMGLFVIIIFVMLVIASSKKDTSTQTKFPTKQSETNTQEMIPIWEEESFN